MRHVLTFGSKRVINEREQFDFLRHLAEGIPEEAEATSPAKTVPKRSKVIESSD